MMTNVTHSLRRASLLLLGASALVYSIAACSDFLVADNPGAVEEKDVNNPAYLDLIAAGPIQTFQAAYTDNLYWNAQLADELYNRAVFIEEGQIDRREMYSEMTYINAFMYAPMQRARFVADDAARRIRAILDDAVEDRDLRVARSMAYAGYGYVMLAEMMCVTPIDLGVPQTWAEMMTTALAKFDTAIDVADAAKLYQQSQPVPDATQIAIADSIRYLALVGSARAALNNNDLPTASAFAAQVPAAFTFRAYYNDQTANTQGQRNRTWERLTAGSNAVLTNTPFAAMTTDPRIPRITSGARNGTPLSPASYSTFNNVAGAGGAAFVPIMSVRFASGLEAQYIVAEAAGPTAATSTFVDQRRAAGGQLPLALAAGDPQIMVELRDQRSRDFYLDNHRLGDLRRYKMYYGIDLFPKGAYPGSTSGQVYSEAADLLRTASTCWPLPVNEINGNPNIPK